MPWLPVALCAPVLWAISTHLDKYLVERYFKERNVAVLLVFTAFIGVLLLPWVLVYDPGVLGLSSLTIGVVGSSGLLYMAAMYWYLQALQSEEASVVAPFFQLGPIFAYLLAYLVLHEVPTHGQLVGGLVVVLGTGLLSMNPRAPARAPRLRLVGLMLACAFALAVTSVIFKLFAIQDDFWSTTFWTYAGEALFGIVILAIPAYRREFRLLIRSSTVPLLGINGANELINLSGSLIARYAILLAPLGVVQAVGGTTTLFVFLIGTCLSLFFPTAARERLSIVDLVQKGSGVALVTVGVVLVQH